MSQPKLTKTSKINKIWGKTFKANSSQIAVIYLLLIYLNTVQHNQHQTYDLESTFDIVKCKYCMYLEECEYMAHKNRN